MSHLLLLVLIGLLITVVVVGLFSLLFLRFAPTFGGKPDAQTQSRIQASANFDGKTFTNLTKTYASTVDLSLFTEGDSQKQGNFLWQFIFPPKDKNPVKPIVTQPLQLIAANAHHDATTTLKNGEFVWLGHSTVLFRTADTTILTDPVFHRATPLSIGVKPFAMTHTPSANDMPFVDAVLISHDHYDHLDYKAIKQLRHKVGHFYVPLGVKAHLMRWGVPAAKISEFDWYESAIIGKDKDHINNSTGVEENKADITDGVKVTFTPTRHFSGRRIQGHRETLWGSWVVQSPDLSVYFSGDGGYSPEFANIGKRFGGFNIAFIEDGAYNERWRDVHMLPEESAQAGIDVGAKVVLPIHWGKFDLSTHHWREPVRRIKAAFDGYNAGKAEHEQIAVATPRIGEVFSLQDLPTSPWWEE